MTTHLSQDLLNTRFDYFVKNDRIDPREIFIRHIIVLSCSFALWFATDQSVMLLWGAGYVMLNTLYVRYLRKCRAPITTTNLRVALAGSIVVAAWFCVMVIYIATLGDGELIMLALFGCIGLGLHCISRNSDLNYSALIDLTATLICSASVILLAALSMPQLWLSFATAIGGLSVSAYFFISFRQILADRHNLAVRVRAEIQDQKMRALGQLTSGIAHDFNNLLTVVSGNVELALLDPDPRQTRHYLDEAHSAADRGASLVRQLLAYARQSKLNAVEIDLNELCGRMSTVLSRLLPAHIKLDVSPPRSPTHVYCDPAMLESAVLNLVINARDEIGDQAGTISIGCRRHPNGRDVLIWVEDDGPGMDDATLQKATEPFFTTKAVGLGSGLGLSMVKGFTEQSGGSLELANRACRGLMVCITLPLADVSQQVPLVVGQTR